jgi:hypothetical protein
VIIKVENSQKNGEYVLKLLIFRYPKQLKNHATAGLPFVREHRPHQEKKGGKK